ncbi:MAG: Coenzyme F420 hydrogenase/dehydrogenase, beta subunit C-terminal domain [Candidatus Saccharibacteria bacterium]|nr:Coenzyme F420 hydrogenase/dehydrogenase, beta subunit C-terminal domain [Candidatus Saccharibacteria bacterium]
MPTLSQICSSCAACANICARQAISMQLDGEGFYRPVVDSSKCVECGACAKVCPWLNNVVNLNSSAEKPRTVAALAKDDSVRKASSSGGIFTVLAKAILAEGGVVAGVAQMASGSFGHIVIDNIADLEKLRGSKYVQANPGLVYKDVRTALREGRKVLFSGTPCQVAALYSVLGKNSFENLWTVDIVCHGTPSVKVWRKYVDELENKESSRLSHVTFRDKSTGWSGYSLIHSYENGKNARVGHGSSVYMNLFLSRICQNTSCSDCRYRKLPRIADITLGDFWGISRFHPQMDDNKGTSVVLLNTEHGESLFNSISDQIRQCESSVENAIAGNPCIVRSSVEHPKRAEFFAELDSKSLNELLKKYCPRIFLYQRCLGSIKRILKCLKK